MIAALFGKRAFRFLLAAACCQALLGYAVISWGAQFLIRVHAMTPTTVGVTFGPIGGIAGALGITIGGHMADRAAAHDVRWYAWLAALESLAAFPFALIFLLAGSSFTALAAFAPFYFLNNMYVGSSVAHTGPGGAAHARSRRRPSSRCSTSRACRRAALVGASRPRSRRASPRSAGRWS